MTAECLVQMLHDVGINNVQKRLRAHYGSEATLSVTGRVGEATGIRLRLPRRPRHRPITQEAAELVCR